MAKDLHPAMALISIPTQPARPPQAFVEAQFPTQGSLFHSKYIWIFYAQLLQAMYVGYEFVKSTKI